MEDSLSLSYIFANFITLINSLLNSNSNFFWNSQLPLFFPPLPPTFFYSLLSSLLFSSFPLFLFPSFQKSVLQTEQAVLTWPALSPHAPSTPTLWGLRFSIVTCVWLIYSKIFLGLESRDIWDHMCKVKLAIKYLLYHWYRPLFYLHQLKVLSLKWFAFGKKYKSFTYDTL